MITTNVIRILVTDISNNKSIVRVCARCEWIFRFPSKDEYIDCPKCGFGSYSARYVYGKKAYKY